MFPPPGTGAVVCAFGELVQDQVCAVDEPFPNEGLIDGRVTFHRGGCAPNVVAAVASQGLPARFLGHFGADPVSSNLAEQLQRAGVRMVGVRRGRGASSLCIQMPTGEPVQVFDPGDSRSIAPADIRSRWLADAALLHLNSHHLFAEATAPAFWRMTELAKDRDVPISLDVASANGVERFGADSYLDALREIRPAVLMANEAEGAAIGLSEGLPAGVAVALHHRGAQPTVVRLVGSDSWEVATPVCDDIIDTIGAGDYFAGGFLAGWVQGRSLRSAVELGHELAVASIQRPGCELPKETSLKMPKVS